MCRVHYFAVYGTEKTVHHVLKRGNLVINAWYFVDGISSLTKDLRLILNLRVLRLKY